jgi:hypothetical protein
MNMGWDFTHGQTRAQLLAELLHGAVASVDCGPKASPRDHVWAVFELAASAGRDAGRKIAVCYLIEYSPEARGYGYKAISEDMGPFEFDIPPDVLALADPEPFGPYSAEWRERVKDYHDHVAAGCTPREAYEIAGQRKPQPIAHLHQRADGTVSVAGR